MNTKNLFNVEMSDDGVIIGKGLEELIRFTISEWATGNEKMEPDHKELVNNFIEEAVKDKIKDILYDKMCEEMRLWGRKVKIIHPCLKGELGEIENIDEGYYKINCLNNNGTKSGIFLKKNDIELVPLEDCPACHGTGDNGNYEPCPKCMILK